MTNQLLPYYKDSFVRFLVIAQSIKNDTTKQTSHSRPHKARLSVVLHQSAMYFSSILLNAIGSCFNQLQWVLVLFYDTCMTVPTYPAYASPQKQYHIFNVSM